MTTLIGCFETLIGDLQDIVEEKKRKSGGENFVRY